MDFFFKANGPECQIIGLAKYIEVKHTSSIFVKMNCLESLNEVSSFFEIGQLSKSL